MQSFLVVAVSPLECRRLARAPARAGQKWNDGWVQESHYSQAKGIAG
jgi:hypothetical protein